MAKAKKKTVAKRGTTDVALAGEFEDDADGGFENADADSYAIPFLAILQSGSPQCKRSEGAFIKGAEEGMLFNTVDQALFDGDEGVTVVPVYFKRAFIEWGPRDSGGGFVAEHNVADAQELLKTCERNDKGQDELPSGNYLVDTRSHYALLIKETGVEPIIISMSSTQLKKSRRWMTMMQNIKLKRNDGSLFTPPMFSHMYGLNTIAESNDKGSWYGWSIHNTGIVEDSETYQQAKALRDAITSGEAKASTPQQEQVSEEEDF